ncbi:hypothetical protein P9112_004867 [Eukaryota sp. TZLM1-RC]
MSTLSASDPESAWSGVKKYSAYVDAINNALTYFLKSKDWTDLIKAIKRIQTIFESSRYSHLKFIPHKHLLAKRIAQSFSPALPSGVHLHAISLLDLIFSRIGDALCTEFHIYSVGLLPLALHCATPVKLPLINLFSTHLLPLGMSLSPFLPALLAALFPGIEEESSENYQETLDLITSFKNIDESLFISSTFRAITSSPPCRYSALLYLTQYYKDKGIKNVVFEDPADIHLSSHSLENCLYSDNTLVQRAALDLLVANFYLSETVFSTETLVSLFKAACLCLCKRELSLTRRIWKWILGDSEDYFELYSKKILLTCIDQLFTSDKVICQATDDVAYLVSPYQVCEYLLSKSEIANVILTPCLRHVINHVYECLFSNPDSLFGCFDSDYEFRSSVLDGFVALIRNLNVSVLWKSIQDISEELIQSKMIDQWARMIDVLTKIVSLLPIYCNDSHTYSSFFSFIFTSAKNLSSLLTSNSESEIPNFSPTISNILCLFNYCFSVMWGSMDTSTLTVPPSVPHWYKKELYEVSRAQNSEEILEKSSQEDQYREIFDEYCLLICSILSPETPPFSNPLLQSITSSFQVITSYQSLQWTGHSTVGSIINHLITTISDSDPNLSITCLSCLITLQLRTPQITSLVSPHSELIIKTLWSFLKPSKSLFHRKASTLLSSMDRLYPSETSSIILNVLNSTEIETKISSMQMFATLWNYSTLCLNVTAGLFNRPLFTMLEAVYSDNANIRSIAVNFCVNSCHSGHISSILDPLISILLDDTCSIVDGSLEFSCIFDFDRILYAIRTLDHLIKKIWSVNRSSLTSEVSVKVDSLYKLSTVYGNTPHKSKLNYQNPTDPSNYFELLLLTALKFIDAKCPKSWSISDVNSKSAVSLAAMDFFSDLASIFIKIKSERHSKSLLNPTKSVLSLFKSCFRPRSICYFNRSVLENDSQNLLIAIRLITSVLEVTEGYSSADDVSNQSSLIDSPIELIEEHENTVSNITAINTSPTDSQQESTETAQNNDSTSPLAPPSPLSHTFGSPRSDSTASHGTVHDSSTLDEVRLLCHTLTNSLVSTLDVSIVRSLTLFCQSLVPVGGEFSVYFTSCGLVGSNSALIMLLKKQSIVVQQQERVLLLLELIRSIVEFVESNGLVTSDDSGGVFDIVTDTIAAPFKFIGGVVGGIFTDTSSTSRSDKSITLGPCQEVVNFYLSKLTETLIYLYGMSIDQLDYSDFAIKFEIVIIGRILNKYIPQAYTSCLSKLWFVFMSSKPFSGCSFSNTKTSLLTPQQKALLHLCTHEILLSLSDGNNPELVSLDLIVSNITDTLISTKRRSNKTSFESINQFGSGTFQNDDVQIELPVDGDVTQTPSHQRSESSSILADELCKSSLSIRAIELGFVHFASCLMFSLLNTLTDSHLSDFVEKCQTVVLNPVDLPRVSFSGLGNLDIRDKSLIMESFKSLTCNFLSVASIFSSGSTAASSISVVFDCLCCLLISGSHIASTFKTESDVLSLLKSNDFFDNFGKITTLMASIAHRSYSFSPAKLTSSLAANEDGVRLFFQVSAIEKFTRVWPIVLDCGLLGDSSTALVNGLLEKFMPKMFTEAQNHSPYAIKLLNAIKFDSRASSTLKQKVLDLFNDDHFFHKTNTCLSNWTFLINHCISNPFAQISGDAAVSQFVNALNSIYPPRMMYLSNVSESRNRVGFIYRLAFLLFSGEYNAFSNKVGVVLEKVMDLLSRHGKGSANITIACLLCLRCLLARVSHQHLRCHWGSITPEIIRVCSSQSPYTLLLAVAKFLDILLVVSPEDLIFHQWIFFKDLLLSRVQYDGHLPCVSSIANSLDTVDNMEIDNSVLTLRSPLITSPVLTDENDAQAALMSIIPALVRHATVECSLERSIDHRAIDKSILLDFVEGENLVVPVNSQVEWKCFAAELYCKE